MDDYIDVKINVFEHTGQHARLKKTLTVRGLIEEILKEFDDIGAETPEKYVIQLKGMEKPLDPAMSLAQLDIQPQDQLSLGYLHQTIRKMLDPKDFAVLREETSNFSFDIQWYPALIGRPSTDVNHNILLAANMQLLAMGLTISRRHAQITFSRATYFVEALADNNPVYLNGKEVLLNKPVEIRFGDRISLGQHKITFRFEKKSSDKPLVQEPISQPREDFSAQSIRSSQSQPVSQPISPSVAHMVSEPVSAVPVDKIRPVANGMVHPTSLVMEKTINVANIGGKIAVQAYPFILGRAIILLSSETEVSRQHAEIGFDANKGSYTFKDLNSTNGSTVNGVVVQPQSPVELHGGDRIGLGRIVILRFEVTE
ncbi:MAG: hypothetical protein CVU39_16375 [Chloroflexi bacterium HGW-Chloroflexi-10]|nr:MAG: hypothetical protein CVU39_16375 [Chloroflexi bacterium HGW-Chloroflexi-10]